MTTPGIDELVEACTRNDLLDDSLVKVATEMLKQEGAEGARDLARLIQELLLCRSGKIQQALWAAGNLSATSELTKAVKAVLAAEQLAPQPVGARFVPDIFGEGRVGWADSERVRHSARGALAAWGLEEAPAARAESDPESWTEKQREVAAMVRRVAAREGHLYPVQARVAEAGPEAIPVLKRLLRADLNGPVGVAAVQSLERVEPPLALEVVEAAIGSDNGSVLNVSIAYLECHRTPEGTKIAERWHAVVKREDFRARLKALAPALSSGAPSRNPRSSVVIAGVCVAGVVGVALAVPLWLSRAQPVLVGSGDVPDSTSRAVLSAENGATSMKQSSIILGVAGCAPAVFLLVEDGLVVRLLDFDYEDGFLRAYRARIVKPMQAPTDVVASVDTSKWTGTCDSLEYTATIDGATPQRVTSRGWSDASVPPRYLAFNVEDPGGLKSMNGHEGTLETTFGYDLQGGRTIEAQTFLAGGSSYRVSYRDYKHTSIGKLAGYEAEVVLASRHDKKITTPPTE